MLADSPRSANQSGFATEHTRTLEIVGASGDAMIDCPIALAMVVTRLANAAPWLSIATPFNEIWNLIFTFFWQTLRPIYPAVVVIVVLTVIRARLVKPWSESVVKHFVFISHRHSVDPWGDLIKTQLATIFGKKAIFLDNDEVKSGDKFDKVIDPALKKCGAFLAVIGTGWLNEIRQLDESHSKDWVRLEIATILKTEVHPIPVLVGDAEKLKELPVSELPDDIRDIAGIAEARIRERKYQEDCVTLSHDIVRTLSLRNKFRLCIGNHATRIAGAMTIGAAIIVLLGTFVALALKVLSF